MSNPSKQKNSYEEPLLQKIKNDEFTISIPNHFIIEDKEKKRKVVVIFFL